MNSPRIFPLIQIAKLSAASLSFQESHHLELKSKIPVDDGRWHQISANFNPTYVEIIVDGDSESLRPDQGQGQAKVDLSGLLYFGGIEEKQKEEALKQGIQSSVEDLKGCLKDLEVDGRKVGLPDVVQTAGIQPGCPWSFPCEEDRALCSGNGGGRCVQKGLTGYECRCSRGRNCDLGKGSSSINEVRDRAAIVFDS